MCALVRSHNLDWAAPSRHSVAQQLLRRTDPEPCKPGARFWATTNLDPGQRSGTDGSLGLERAKSEAPIHRRSLRSRWVTGAVQHCSQLDEEPPAWSALRTRLMKAHRALCA